MLDINVEFRKGILFVRLEGVLDQVTTLKLNKEVTSLIKEIGIKNTVFNLEYLTRIDNVGIKELIKNYNFCKENKGDSFICNLNSKVVRKSILKSHLNNFMKETVNELTAIKIISI